MRSPARASMASRTIRLIPVMRSHLRYPAPRAAHPTLNLGACIIFYLAVTTMSQYASQGSAMELSSTPVKADRPGLSPFHSGNMSNVMQARVGRQSLTDHLRQRASEDLPSPATVRGFSLRAINHWRPFSIRLQLTHDLFSRRSENRN